MSDTEPGPEREDEDEDEYVDDLWTKRPYAARWTPQEDPDDRDQFER
jgi:hypothetical protein